MMLSKRTELTQGSIAPTRIFLYKISAVDATIQHLNLGPSLSSQIFMKYRPLVYPHFRHHPCQDEGRYHYFARHRRHGYYL